MSIYIREKNGFTCYNYDEMYPTVMIHRDLAPVDPDIKLKQVGNVIEVHYGDPKDNNLKEDENPKDKDKKKS